MNTYMRDLRIGMSRRESFANRGNPDCGGGATRRKPYLYIYKYGPVEVVFEHAGDGKPLCVRVRDSEDNPVRLLGEK